MKKLVFAFVLLFAVSLFTNCTPESQAQDQNEQQWIGEGDGSL